MGALQRELQQLEERLDRLLSGSSVIVTIDTLLAQLQELAASTPSATSAAVAVASADHAAAAAHPASILDTASVAAAASSAVPRTPFARFGATAPVATNPALPVMLQALRSDAQSVILDLRQQMVTKRREIKALFARSSSLKCVRPLRPTPLRRARLARAASCVADAARCARRGNVLTPFSRALSATCSLRYELQSLIIRSGGNPSDASASVASVHYYAYARDTAAADGTWLRLDDGRVAKGEISFFVYRYIVRESCSQFDSLPLTSLTIHWGASRKVLRRAPCSKRRTAERGFRSSPHSSRFSAPAEEEEGMPEARRSACEGGRRTL